MERSRLCIFVCDSFRHEINALARELRHPDVEFLTFPTRCARPPITWEDLARLIPSPARFDKIILIGNCCLDHLAASPEKVAHLHTVRLKHCFSLLLGDYAIDKYQEQGAYLVSSGWLGDWEKHVAALGLDAEMARDLFSESAASIIHLDTGVLDTAPGYLMAFSQFVSRPQQTVHVGHDLLRLRVERLIGDWKSGRQIAEERRTRQASQKKGADHAMALDLLKMIVQTTGSQEAIREILQLYLMMFAASELAYVPLCGGKKGEVTRIGSGPALADEMLQKEALCLDADYRLLPSGDGFQLRVAHKGRMLGMIHMDGITMHQNLEQYLNLALETVAVCAVVLDNSMNFERVLAISHRLKQSEEALEQTNRDLEERVQARTAELEASLREQASFSYSVSHDLRAPLRHINSFSTLLLEEHASCLPDEARHYLDRICQSTRNMGELIDSLLELARVARTATEMKPVDLSDLAMGAAGVLQEKGAGHVPEFKVEEGIEVTGDAALLRQVLYNLLGNAWKFTSGKASPVIEFGRTFIGGREAFFVRDNGVGFDMAYSKKLFEVFERLHGNEFEGTGIGLATAQRIIQRHGGSIWAEGRVDDGATFYFTLSELPEAAVSQSAIRSALSLGQPAASS